MTMPSEPGPKSSNTSRPSRRPMEVVAERQIPDQPTSQGTASPMSQPMTNASPMTTIRGMTATPESLSPEPRNPRLDGVMGAINVLALVLSARLIVLVAVAGAIGLSVVVLEHPDPYSLIALGVYHAGCLVPAIWLSSRGG
jgi:hypothetical protein